MRLLCLYNFCVNFSVLIESRTSSILLSMNVPPSEFLCVRCVLAVSQACRASAWAAWAAGLLPGCSAARTGPPSGPLYTAAAAQNTTQLDPDYDGNQRFASRVCNQQIFAKTVFCNLPNGINGALL